MFLTEPRKRFFQRKIRDRTWTATIDHLTGAQSLLANDRTSTIKLVSGYLVRKNEVHKITKKISVRNHSSSDYSFVIRASESQQGRTEDALTQRGDEGRSVTAISFGEPSSRL